MVPVLEGGVWVVLAEADWGDADEDEEVNDDAGTRQDTDQDEQNHDEQARLF